MDNSLYAIFNKQNKKFVCFSIGKESLSPETLSRKIEIEGNFNLSAYEWVGDYDEGQFIDKTSVVYRVSETDVQKAMFEKFFRKYEPMYVIMNIVNTLLIQSEKDQLLWLDPAMKEMLAFYKKLLIKTENDVAFYKDSKFHKYISTEEHQKEFTSRLETKNGTKTI
ncbi:MAG: hypothetical protein WCI60_03325 [bacterium]